MLKAFRPRGPVETEACLSYVECNSLAGFEGERQADRLSAFAFSGREGSVPAQRMPGARGEKGGGILFGLRAG